MSSFSLSKRRAGVFTKVIARRRRSDCVHPGSPKAEAAFRLLPVCRKIDKSSNQYSFPVLSQQPDGSRSRDQIPTAGLLGDG